MNAQPATSVVLPVYRNRDVLETLCGRLVRALAELPGSFELLFVDDNSPDGSLSVLQRLAGRDARVRVIALDSRSGQMAALRAGIAAARGRTIVTMDADLQDPPEAIPSLLSALDQGGWAAVYAGRRGRYESSRRLASSWVFKHAISLVTGMPADAGSFVAMRREVAQRILALPGAAPYLTGAVAWVGRRVTSIPVERAPRHDGSSSYTTGMRFHLGVRALSQAIGWRIRGAGARPLPRRAVPARAWCAVALALAAGLFTTTHGDVGWDGTWMLQVIARVREGEVLYRDVFCGVPPLVVYLGRGAVAVLGVELVALRALLVGVVTFSYLVSADLVERLTGSRRYDVVLAPLTFAWALPANVPLYQPLANLFLLSGVDAALIWALRVRDAGDGRLRWLAAAGVSAGLSFAAKPTTGALAAAAVGIVAIAAIAQGGRSGARAVALACGAASLAFAMVVTLLLVPVAWSGGWEKFLDYSFLNKGTYLRVGRVPYFEELATYLAALPRGAATDPVLAVKGQPLLLPFLLVAPVVAAWRAWRQQSVAAATVAALVAVELATLFPRADIDHVVPAVPGFLVAILFAWHAAAGPGRDVGRRRGAAGWRRRAAAACLVVIAAACLVRLSASGAALVSPARTWSSLPHLAGVLIPRARQTELGAHANALRGAAADGSLFLLVPDAGLYYLVSGLRNPTPFDYPLGTAFGRTGEADLAAAIGAGRVARVCMSPVSGTMAPDRLQAAVAAHLQPRTNLGRCTVYEGAR
jgi:hypothetical protein